MDGKIAQPHRKVNVPTRATRQIFIASPTNWDKMPAAAEESSALAYDDVHEGGENAGGFKRNIILAVNIFVMFVSYLCLSSISPFFPYVAASECGIDPFYIGIVTATYPLGMFVSSIATGIVLPIIGTKPIVLTCLFFASLSAVAFGGVPHVACDAADNSSFIYFVVIRSIQVCGIKRATKFQLQVIQGIAAGGAETSILFALSIIFPDRLGEVHISLFQFDQEFKIHILFSRSFNLTWFLSLFRCLHIKRWLLVFRVWLVPCLEEPCTRPLVFFGLSS